MDIHDRIKVAIQLLIGYKIASNQEEVGRLLGYTNKSSFSQVVNGKTAVPSGFLKNLAALDDRISEDWLTNDIGETPCKQVYNETTSHILLAKPYSLERFGDKIPLVKTTAIGGFGNSNFAIDDRDVKDYYVIPKFQHKKVDFMIEVEGSSMYPKYNSGDVVAC